MRKFKKLYISTLVVCSLFLIVPIITPTFGGSSISQAANLNTYYRKITKGSTYTLKMKGTTKKITWSSSNKKVATVNSKGKVTAKKAGTAYITAKIGKKRYVCRVVVVNPPPKISNQNIKIIKKNTYTLKMLNTSKTVKWSSSNKKVATVNSKGKVTAVGKGTTYIKAKVGGKTYSCKVTVENPYFSASKVNMYVSDVKTYALNGTSKSVSYKSSNSSIVKVAKGGKVTAVKAGTATITATVDKKNYTYKITVKNKPQPAKLTGWKTVNGKKYYYENGNIVKGLKCINGRKYFFDNSGVLSSQFGIDVSEFQKEINWEAAKADGVEFAIIRCGFGMDQLDQDDDQFLRNVSECKRLGIPYGIYLYSYANTLEKASSEAEHVLRLLSRAKASPKLGIWYDVEDKIQANLEKTLLTQIIEIFCNKIKQKGYSVGIYSTTKWLMNKLDCSITENYPIWVAQYYEQCEYNKKYVMWQYTSSGCVKGVPTNTDLNIRFLK